MLSFFVQFGKIVRKKKMEIKTVPLFTFSLWPIRNLSFLLKDSVATVYFYGSNGKEIVNRAFISFICACRQSSVKPFYYFSPRSYDILKKKTVDSLDRLRPELTEH